MVEHTDIVLWHHDFNVKISKILTKANSVRRIKEEIKYQKTAQELNNISDSLEKLFDDINVMGNEIFIELKRLRKED